MASRSALSRTPTNTYTNDVYHMYIPYVYHDRMMMPYLERYKMLQADAVSSASCLHYRYRYRSHRAACPPRPCYCVRCM